MRMRRYFALVSTPGTPVPLAIDYTCEWNMIIKRFLWSANVVPTTPSAVYIRRLSNPEIGISVPLVSVDPVECDLYQWMLTDHIELQKGDRILAAYSNPDDLISTIEMILEQI